MALFLRGGKTVAFESELNGHLSVWGWGGGGVGVSSYFFPGLSVVLYDLLSSYMMKKNTALSCTIIPDGQGAK